MRATVDWDDPDSLAAQLDPAFLPKLAVWDATFTVPYHAFRSELRRIARLNLSHVEGAACSDWEAIPDGALVVPVDDDDWFAPNLATMLASRHNPDAIAYRWTSTFLEVPTTFGHHVHLARRLVLPGTPAKQFCTTNNYALIKRPGVRLLAANHMRAGEALAGHPQVEQVAARLSLMNRTIASQTTIGHRSPGVTRGHLVRKYRRYRRLYARAGPRMPEWARPYVGLTGALMQRLELRKERS